MPSLLAISGTEAPAASSASTWRSLRTICSGVCRFFNFESPPSTHLGRSDSHSSWISFRGAGQSGVSIHRIVDGQIGETWWRFEARLHEESQQSAREENREFLLQGKPLEVDPIICAGICHVLRGCRKC